MEVQAHTTPDNRRLLRDYLRNRRLTTSMHNTIMVLVLNDLEEALRLLEGIHHPSATWSEAVEDFLVKRLPPPPGPDPRWALPGLLEDAASPTRKGEPGRTPAKPRSSGPAPTSR